MLWTRGVAARETLSYLDRSGIAAEPALSAAGISRRQLSQDDIGLSVASQYRFLELAAAEANDQLLGLHVAAEMDIRAIGLLFYLTGSSRTLSEALENLARYSATTNEALVVEISPQKDEVIVAIRRVQEFDEPHRQFFELLALWLVRVLHSETNRDFTLSRVLFTDARNADLREVHRRLRCPVDFAQGVDSWVLPQRVMDLPIVSGDSQLLKILTAHADDLLAERHSVTGLQSMVANQLASLLPSGRVAGRGGGAAARHELAVINPALADEGTTFGEILEQLRRALPLVTWWMTACRSSRSPGCSAIRRSERSITLTKGGPEQHLGERENLLLCRPERGFSQTCARIADDVVRSIGWLRRPPILGGPRSPDGDQLR